jgi:hypothetical protein
LEGATEGDTEGAVEGDTEGAAEGDTEGVAEGDAVGANEGVGVGVVTFSQFSANEMFAGPWPVGDNCSAIGFDEPFRPTNA